MKAILCAFLAALFYAVNIPLSKLLLDSVGPTTMAALLYLGAGIGVGIMALFMAGGRKNSAPLSRRDIPFVIGMIVLDIAAPILLMLGIRHGSPANASLLGNFEIVATAVVALFFFKEAVSLRLWTAIAFAKREPMPGFAHICEAMILGFVAYGLSIFLYVRAQNTLGAAKTSAYYAVAPFAGALLSFAILGDRFSWMFLFALVIMSVGAVLVVLDTLVKHHTHLHSLIFSHCHDGTIHEHTVVHSHVHDHCASMEKHTHKHPLAQLEESVKNRQEQCRQIIA